MLGSLLRLTILIYGWSLVLPIIAGAARGEVTIGFAEEASVGGVLLDLYYPGNGTTVGAAGDVDCLPTVPGALASFNNKTEQGIISAASIRVESFGGPDLIRCVWDGDPIDADDLAAVTVDATTADLDTIVPSPALVVSNVNCAEALGDSCGDVDGSGSVTATGSRNVLESANGLNADCNVKL